ncbi:MAG: macro domain-containing protein [Succinivibrio sp.]|jgi:O-acetyl-ADP-ribose deacetylase (regulator of RNase III)|nr:macro domain-containing protein [Succinivibrio sp.]
MDRKALVEKLTEMLLSSSPSLKGMAGHFDGSYETQRMLLRGLMNMYQPDSEPSQEFFALQDELLGAERDERPAVEFAKLPLNPLSAKVRLYRGDLLDLKTDAVVNPANSSLLGCFIAGHDCVDNLIHSAAGLQLRFECKKLIEARGAPLKPGEAVITGAYNLKASKIIHTVAPEVSGHFEEKERKALTACYVSCLEIAKQHHLTSVAFPCLGSGGHAFPHAEAAAIAVRAVSEQLQKDPETPKAVFVCEDQVDYDAYALAFEEEHQRIVNPGVKKKPATLSALWDLTLK